MPASPCALGSVTSLPGASAPLCTKQGVVIVGLPPGWGQVPDKVNKAGSMEQWWTAAPAVVTALTAIIAIIQNTGVITHPCLSRMQG